VCDELRHRKEMVPEKKMVPFDSKIKTYCIPLIIYQRDRKSKRRPTKRGGTINNLVLLLDTK